MISPWLVYFAIGGFYTLWVMMCSQRYIDDRLAEVPRNQRPIVLAASVVVGFVVMGLAWPFWIVWDTGCWLVVRWYAWQIRRELRKREQFYIPKPKVEEQ